MKPTLGNLPQLPPRVHLTPAQRADFAAKVIAVYKTEPVTIRAICRQTGRSYGAIHRILATADAPTHDEETSRS